MTLKKSLFDFGIYKSVIKRFSWGAVAYFILLFFSSVFRVLVYTKDELADMYRYTDQRVILSDDFRFASMMISIFVPIVAALLIFRFLHSKKQNIFVHSLPVTRTCNFISSVLGGFTLMSAPILANGFLLFILSIFGYRGVIYPSDCGVWILSFLVLIFVIFSLAVFSCIITGNSFASVAIYGILNFLPLIVAFIVSSIGEMFVYGYYNDGEIMEYALINNPIVWSGRISLVPMTMYTDTTAVLSYLILSVVLYILSLYLYNLRNGEKPGDVTAFSCMNPIIKYFVTFSLGITFFYILFSSNTSIGNVALVLYSLLFTAIIYFICEMILKKEFKVFGAYKGCIALCAISVIVIGTISLTGFFGYSKFVPDSEDIEYATVLNYLGNNPSYSAEEGAISLALNLHNEKLKESKFIQRRTKLEDYNNSTSIFVSYKLKDGSNIVRKYLVPYNRAEELIGQMYEFNDFKYSYNQILSIDTENVLSLNFVNYKHDQRSKVTDSVKIAEFMEIYKEELSKLSYAEMYRGVDSKSNGYVEIEAKSIDEDGTYHINYHMSEIHAKSPKSNEWISNYIILD